MASLSRMSLAPISNMASAEGSDEKKVRVLQCFDCKTMEVLPYFEGDSRDDVTLHYVDDKHGGHEEETARIHNRALHVVIERFWDHPKIRRKMVADMWKGSPGFAPEYYDFKNTLKDDAFKCWERHHRPGINSSSLCSDYRDSSKRIGNPAYQDRVRMSRELRDHDLRHSGPKVYLCQFCPYDMDVQHMKADKYGDFSEKLN